MCAIAAKESGTPIRTFAIGMERDAIEACYALKDKVLATGDEMIVRTWRRLQTSDRR